MLDLGFASRWLIECNKSIIEVYMRDCQSGI